MSLKHKMKSSVINVARYNKNGSYRTQNDRLKSLLSIATELHHLGYKMESLKSMKQKHIHALIKQWNNKGTVSPNSMRNRMSHIRWLMAKWNKVSMVPSNKELNILPKKSNYNQDKSIILSEEDLSKISDPYMLMSIQAQMLFGLRVEESLKIQPFIADAGDFLFLKGSWCKGGRERTLPITNSAQKKWLENAKTLVQHTNNSLIPDDTTYKTYRKRFDKATERAGINKKHGLRHKYAHQLYEEYTGWECPAAGGQNQDTYTPTQKTIDKAARLQISVIFGHSRQFITRNYCG